MEGIGLTRHRLGSRVAEVAGYYFDGGVCWVSCGEDGGMGGEGEEDAVLRRWGGVGWCMIWCWYGRWTGRSERDV